VRIKGSSQTFAVALLIIGLAAGAVVGYFAVSSSAQNKILDYEGRIADLNSQESTKNKEISHLESQVSDLESQVSDLKSQIS